MSPLMRHRIDKFKKNRRGFWALWIFLTFFGMSLLANFIANDKPLLVKYQRGYYFPVLKDYPETLFGGDFPTPPDYKDPFVQNKINQKGWMVFPLIEFSHQTINYNSFAPAPPSLNNLLGVDDQGRDVLAQIIYGFRISVLFAVILTFFSTFIGVLAGGVQGYFGGKIDLFFQRFLEMWGSLPQLFILIIIYSIFQPSFWTLLFVLILFSWTALVSVVRAEFLKARNLEYVKAAKALGMTDFKIMFKHILPNAMVATLTFVPFILSGAITTLVALDFLGFGLPTGVPSLGEILRQGKENLQAPWLGLSGFIIIGFILCLLIFIGEAVRDAFDPRKDIK